MKSTSVIALMFLGAIAFFAIACQVMPVKSTHLEQIYAEMTEEMDVGPSPQECIAEIFSNGDAYDPSSHFQIQSGSAPPYPEAVMWINEALTECLRGEIDVD